jgi:sugar phosphate isomerase/epimerase
VQIGTYSYFGYPLTFKERVVRIREAGFEITSIGLGREEEFVRKGDKDAMADLVRSEGLFIEYAHAPEDDCNNLWSPSEGERGTAVAAYASSIDFCRRNRISMVVLHISRSKGKGPAPQNRHGLRAMEKLVKYAEDSNVKIAVENTQEPHYLDYVFSSLQSPCLRFCYDSSHDFLYSPEPCSLLRKWGHLLATTHLSDNDGTQDRHWLPGEGIIRWDEMKNSFPRTYDGTLNLEIFPKDPENETATRFLKRAHESIMWVKGLLG